MPYGDSSRFYFCYMQLGLMFGEGLTTRPECLTEDSSARRRPWLQRAFVLSEHTPKE